MRQVESARSWSLSRARIVSVAVLAGLAYGTFWFILGSQATVTWTQVWELATLSLVSMMLLSAWLGLLRFSWMAWRRGSWTVTSR